MAAGTCIIDFSMLFSIAVPGKASKFKVVEVGSHHFGVEWMDPMEPNGIIVGYTLGFREGTGFILAILIHVLSFVSDINITYNN